MNVVQNSGSGYEIGTVLGNKIFRRKRRKMLPILFPTLNFCVIPEKKSAQAVAFFENKLFSAQKQH